MMTLDTAGVVQSRRAYLDSLHQSPHTFLVGMAASATAMMVCYLKSGDPRLLAFSAIMVLTAVARYANYLDYWRMSRRLNGARFGAREFRIWSGRTIAFGTLTAFYSGYWCIHAFAFNNDPFEQMTALVFAVANAAGITARNFSSPTLVRLQCLMIGVPLNVATLFFGTWYHSLLGVMFISYFLTIERASASMRTVFTKALERETETRESAEQLTTAFETVPNGLMMFDRDGWLRLANEKALTFLEVPGAANIHGYNTRAIVRLLAQKFSLDRAKMDRLLCLLDEKEAPDAAADEDLTAQGSLYVSHQDIGSFQLTTGNSPNGSVILRIDDITQQMDSRKRIKRLSRYDELSGLANRAWFFKQVRSMMFNEPDEPVLVALIDVNEFKHINDTRGHAAGDEVLKSLGANLRSEFGASAHCGRLGGDEFVLAMQIKGDEEESLIIAERLEACINVRVEFEETLIGVTCSLGVCAVADSRTDIDAIISNADFALYTCKRSDELTFAIFDDAMAERMNREDALLKGLAGAISAGDLSSVYQPLICARTGRPQSAEALARWTHPELGPISPGEFVPLAEQTGAIRQLTAWQLTEACRSCAGWPGDLSVSVNLSAKDFATDEIVAIIKSAFTSADLPPQRLIVEVTETSFLDMRKDVLDSLDAIRAMGVRVAVDDFGVGYSSLGYLRVLPFDILKIDRSFISDICSNETGDDLAILSSITGLARRLNKTVVIEGVETIEQLELLKENVEVDLFQGFLFGKPLPEAQAAAFFDAHMPSAPSRDRTIAGSKTPRRLLTG